MKLHFVDYFAIISWKALLDRNELDSSTRNEQIF